MNGIRRLAACIVLLLCAAPAAAQSEIAVVDRDTTLGPGSATSVRIIDAGSGRLRARFSAPVLVGSLDATITSTPDGRRLLVPNGGTLLKLFVFDAGTGALLANVALSPEAGAPFVAVSPDGTRAYVAAHGDGPSGGPELYVVDLTTYTLITTVFGPQPARAFPRPQIAVSPDGASVYVRWAPFGLFGGADALGVLRYSTATLTLQATLPQATLDNSPLAVTPDSARLLVWGAPTGASASGLLVYDTATNALLRTLAIAQPIALRSPAPGKVFAAYPDRVELYDIATGALIGSASLAGVTALGSDATAALVDAVVAGGIAHLDPSTGAAAFVPAPVGDGSAATVLSDRCPADVSAGLPIYQAEGGSGTLFVTAAPGCSWNVDTSGIQGLTPQGATAGSGSAAIPFTLAAATSPQLGVVHVGVLDAQIEQRIGLMTIESPKAGANGQPFVVSGWALEWKVGRPYYGIDAVHAWAFPAGGGAPRFVGAASRMTSRSDIRAQYGFEYEDSGFDIQSRGLPAGAYTLVVYARVRVTGLFSIQRAVAITVDGPKAAIDTPSAPVPRNFVVSGWAVDVGAGSGSGVDAIHVWAYPASGGAPIWVGEASYGGVRPDLASLLGQQFLRSGYFLFANLPAGAYTLVVFAHSTVTGQFDGYARPLTVVPDSAPQMNIDDPVPGSTISGPFSIRGWGVDLGAAGGTGIDAFHVWAFPIDGTPPVWVAAAAPTARPDVANIFGPQFGNAGFQVSNATVPRGTYDLAVFGRSTVTQSFSLWRIVRITVP